MPFGVESASDNPNVGIIAFNGGAMSPMPFGVESASDVGGPRETNGRRLGSPMPFGVESASDRGRDVYDFDAASYVTNAFRRRVRVGLAEGYSATLVHGTVSPMPFGVESASDESTPKCNLLSTHSVTNAFRRRVRVGPKVVRIVPISGSWRSVTNAFRRRVRVGQIKG